MAEKNRKKPTQKIVDVMVWQIENMQRIARFTGFHLRAILLLSFSPSGKKLLTVGQDDNHSIAVYNWAQDALIFSAKTSRGKLNAASWQSDE